MFDRAQRQQWQARIRLLLARRCSKRPLPRDHLAQAPFRPRQIGLILGQDTLQPEDIRRGACGPRRIAEGGKRG